MPSLRRRSARLNGNGTAKQSQLASLATLHPPTQLSALVERDETPDLGAQSTMDAIISSPMAPRHSPKAGSISSALQTPRTATRPHLDHAEMHPSKTHQSTTKGPDSALRLGFSDIQAKASTQNTPSKSTVLAPSANANGVDFKFTRPGPELGPEAQKMMNDLREEALTIKARLANERANETSKATPGDTAETTTTPGGRKIAKAKGKAGRYSDVHMNEFKKMDSIAGHASAYRAPPGQSQPVTATTKSLKRTKSKANLDEPDTTTARAKTTMITSKKDQHARETAAETSSPAKRVKHDGKASHGSQLPSAVTTPTKASLARSTGIRSLKKSGSTLARSAASRNAAGRPTEGGNRYLASFGTNLGKMKSMLRRPGHTEAQQSSASNKGSKGPLKQSISAPMTSKTTFKPELVKDLPSLPATPSAHLPPSPSLKRLNLTPHTLAATKFDVSPSPAKVLLQPPSSTASPTKKKPTTEKADTVTYPTLPAVARSSALASHPPTSGDFTFRSPHRAPIVFGPAGGTIRPVRPSVGPGSNAHTNPNAPDAGTTIPRNVPTLPHGMPNKLKRRRAEADDDTEDDICPGKSSTMPGEEKENMEPNAKKQRPNQPQQSSLSRIPSPAKKTAGSGVGSRARGMLSRARLNALARPKGRV
ncbi:MAG: hypothetical protein M1817_004873 [Caeruleum heppii]|nr:MAG: hypothetical protein M1817_004873 [Caeruleum heppii]